MAKLSDFLTLSKRYQDCAEILLDKGEYNVAYYLAGYSVECLIKGIICKKICPNEFPPKNVSSTHYTHSIEQLLQTAGLKKDLEFERERDGQLNTSYLLIKDWNPQDLRYDYSSLSKEFAETYVNQLKNKQGLILWLNKYL